jgi:NitT/TauT family transport system substrate-binding protein
MPLIQTRRQFLTALSLAGAAGLVGEQRGHAAERALDASVVRILKNPGICIAPQYVAEELLRAEGFTDIRYVDQGPTLDLSVKVGRGDADFSLDFAARCVQTIDSGGSLLVLGGVHIGCYELFAKNEIRSISDIKGRNVGIGIGGTNPHAFLAAMAAHVGLDPRQDIRWVISTDPSVRPLELFAEGKIDAFLGTPPEPQQLRARGFSHVIFNSIVDRPWSQYFCCMLTGNMGYVREHPEATKRVLRAILKAADLCATQPARVAQDLVTGGFTDRYDFALQALREVPYDKWREYDPEDTLRYYALRLHEAGMIKSLPNKIIAENTDWHFLNELKRELKA